MTFDRTINVHTGQSVDFIGVDFVAVEVVSDADFDELHPAGSSLNDLFTIFYSTVKPYIDSDYTNYDEVFHICKYSDFLKKLTDISADDLILLGYGTIGRDPQSGKWLSRPASLIFDIEPTLSKAHNFTVTMTADDGRVFSDSVHMIFE